MKKILISIIFYFNILSAQIFIHLESKEILLLEHYKSQITTISKNNKSVFNIKLKDRTHYEVLIDKYFEDLEYNEYDNTIKWTNHDKIVKKYHYITLNHLDSIDYKSIISNFLLGYFVNSDNSKLLKIVESNDNFLVYESDLNLWKLKDTFKLSDSFWGLKSVNLSKPVNYKGFSQFNFINGINVEENLKFIEFKHIKNKNDLYDKLTPDQILLEERIYINNENRPKKPVLYFYPTQNQTITTKINCSKNSKLTYTYPKLDKEWKFNASPDGILTFENGRKYNYLFWEGEETNSNYNLDEGFVVNKENLEAFFIEKLEIMGLKQHELNDFIVYWLPIMMKNEYNFVNFVCSKNQDHNSQIYNNNFDLEIEPKPETLFRIFMIYKPCNQDFKVKEQELPTFQRNGFTVLEWGGMELSRDCLSGR